MAGLPAPFLFLNTFKIIYLPRNHHISHRSITHHSLPHHITPPSSYHTSQPPILTSDKITSSLFTSSHSLRHSPPLHPLSKLTCRHRAPHSHATPHRPHPLNHATQPLHSCHTFPPPRSPPSTTRHKLPSPTQTLRVVSDSPRLSTKIIFSSP